MTTTQTLEAAADKFNAGMESMCQRMYAEAIAKGATDEQAVRAIKLTLIDYFQKAA